MRTLLLGLVLAHAAAAQSWRDVGGLPPGFHGGLWARGDTLTTSVGNVVWTSTDAGATWLQLPDLPGTASLVTAWAELGGVHYAGTAGTGVFRRLPGASVWEEANNGLAGLGALDITGILIHEDTLFAATGGSGVFRALHASLSAWQPHGTGLVSSTSGAVNGFLRVGDTLVAGSGANGYIFLKPANAGAWSPVLIQPPAAPGLQVSDIVGAPGGTLYAAANGRVWRSPAAASGWSRADTSLPIGLWARLALDAAGNLFLGTSSSAGAARVYLSTDGGYGWRLIGAFPGLDLTGLAVSGNRLFASFTGGMQSTRLDSLVLAVPPGGMPAAFALDQNYPNPFNPATDIRFSVPVDGGVSLRVYDLLGREVASLADGALQAGSHLVRWDARNSAGGMYLVRLAAGGRVAMRKILLLK